MNEGVENLASIVEDISKQNIVITANDSGAQIALADSLIENLKKKGVSSELILSPIDSLDGYINPDTKNRVLNSEVWVDFTLELLSSETVLEVKNNDLTYMILTELNAETIGKLFAGKNILEVANSSEVLNEIVCEESLIELNGNGCSLNLTIGTYENYDPARACYWQVPGSSTHPVGHGAINGELFVDGNLVPPYGTSLRYPGELRLIFENGLLKDVAGIGKDAFQDWLETNTTKETRFPFHFTFGYNPNIRKISGNMTEDERLFGSVTLGIGDYANGWHFDAVIKKPTVFLNKKRILHEGLFEDRLGFINQLIGG